ncbi:MAG: ubiquinone/menaquinone biosynthesis methyltransferase [Phycisphaerae bacterium]|nr:ubiquinone/menaquinone biosynthesis methyltransferase [Phycisphaerae bacterium]
MNTLNTKFDFESIAERYDRCNHLLSFGIDHLWRREVIQTLNPKIQQRVLDICTGTGDLAFAFLRHSHSKDVTGLDISKVMIGLAQEKQNRLASKPWIKNKNVRWQVADATKTGLESKSFDFITCAFGIRNIPDRTAVLKEMFRLLKPNGKLCVLEFSLPSNPLLRTIYRLYLNYIMPAAGKLLFGSKEPLKYLARSVHHWHTEVNFVREMSDSGFTLIRKVPLTGGIVTLWLAGK